MNSIVVFCGASAGHGAAYTDAARKLGTKLAQAGIQVVYGGACIGIMGAVADAALAGGGKVVGVIPHFLKTKEVAHEHLTEMIAVETMHERKLKMHELSDGIITLPGGWGTMEELFEMLTWAQLGLHAKPIGLLNVNGYYDHLYALCSNMVQEGFLAAATMDMLMISDDVDDLLQRMADYKGGRLSTEMTEDRT